MFQRYAVFYTPDVALARAGAAWLGWDSGLSTRVGHPDIREFDLTALTKTPRKYGLHGTVKPPFHLQAGTRADDLQTELAKLCAQTAPVTLDGLQVSTLSGFVALVPIGDQSKLASMAASVVTKLDHFRAPPTEAEIARRRATPLNAAQERHLANWGYPYVMDHFRFHMTLSNKSEVAPRLAHVARRYFADHLATPLKINALTFMGQDRAGMFHQLHRYALTGT